MTNHPSHPHRSSLLGRLSWALVCGLLAGALLPQAAYADPSSSELAQEREEIAAEREQIEAERKELEGELADAQAYLDQLGQEIAGIQQELMDAEEELEVTRNEIAETNTKIDETKEQLASSRAALGSHMRSSYKVGPSALVDTLLGATSFEDLVNRIYYLDKISDARADEIDQINALEEELTAHEQELEEVQARQQEEVELTEAKVAEYETKISEARDYYDALDSEVQAKLAEEEEKRAEEEAKRVEEEEAKKAEEEAERQRAEQQSSGVTTAVNAINESQQTSQTAPEGSSDIIANAYQFIGKPYKTWWSGRNYGPDADGYDCCGLVCTAYHMAGYSTPYQTPVAGLMAWVRSHGNWKDCNLGNIDAVLNPGDLVFCSTGHVALYIGNSMMIHAPCPGRYVCVAPVYACIGGGFGG